MSGPYHVLSEKTHPRPPYIVVASDLWVDDDPVRKGVRVGGGNGGDVVFLAVNNGDDLVGGLFERFCHGTADFGDVWWLS